MSKSVSWLADHCAKIARPQSLDPLMRPRLFSGLDGLRARTIVWISAPPGAGKTTLASSYLAERDLGHIWYYLDTSDSDIASFFHYLRLAIQQANPRLLPPPPFTAEYLPGLRTFALRYLQSIAGNGKKPAILVLDNYEQLPGDATLHTLLPDVLSEIPPGLNIFVLSRAEPPPSFARLQLHQRMAILDGHSLNLTLDEAKALACRHIGHGQASRDPATIAKMHEKTRGWFAGFRLLIEGESTPNVPDEVDDKGHQLLFDYFTTELFDRFSTREQTVLLYTASLPSMTGDLAARQSGISGAGEFLGGLQRRGYFVFQHGETEPVYEYHPLFRAFLLQRAKSTLTGDEWREVQRRAANLLTDMGQTVPAARLLAAIGDWPVVTDLVLDEAPAFVSTGRYRTLTETLDLIPQPMREASPWLLYWQGTSKMPFQPVVARADLERAFALFEAQGEDAAGLYLSWANIVETYLVEWRDFKPLDRWIEALAALNRRHPEYPSPDIERRVLTMTLPLMFRDVSNPNLHLTVDKALALLQQTQDAIPRRLLAASLLLPALWLGDFVLASRLTDILEDPGDLAAAPPFVSILGSVYVSAYYWNIGRAKDCVRIVDQALALSEATGMQAWSFLLYAHGVYGHLALGELDRAETHLQRLNTIMHCRTHLMGSHYHYLAARLCEQRGDIAGALQHGRLSLAMAEDAGSPVPQVLIALTMASILTRCGAAEEAAVHLRAARSLAASMHSAMLEFLCLISEAHAAFEDGDAELGHSRLRASLALSRERGGIGMVFHWGPARAAAMYAKALEAGIEVEHVRELIRRSKLPAPESVAIPEAWPWPVRIFTLGRFALIRNGVLLNGSGKARQKPLELLMALLSFRSHEVPKESLSDLLWPEAEGDGAYRALITTLHRLRQLLSHPDAVLVRDGVVALNSRRVWVDAWAFEDTLAQAASTAEGAEPNDAKTLREQALRLYQGEFLTGYALAWTAARRERLRLLYREHLLRLARRFESLGDDQSAADCYLNGIAADETAEAFYCPLIELYLRTGRTAEARDTYLSFTRTANPAGVPALQSLHALLFPAS